MGSAGSALVLAGAILTIAVNIPLNRQLERNLVPWRSYEARWIKANTARALGSALGTVLAMTAGGSKRYRLIHVTFLAAETRDQPA